MGFVTKIFKFYWALWCFLIFYGIMSSDIILVQMAELFDRDIKTIGKHIANAKREELEGQVVVANLATTSLHESIAGKTQIV